MKIDTHNHFWRFNEAEYDWIDDSMQLLRRDYLPGHFKEVLDTFGFDGTIAVQARQSIEETQWLLQLAWDYPFIKGVIGWIDIGSPDLEQQLMQFEGNPLLKGFRHVLQGEPDEFMLQPRFIEGIQLLAEKGYCYEILVFSNQLTAVNRLVKQLPPMRLVVNHLAKPDLLHHDTNDWFEQIATIAEYAHVYCKLSGMVTEANWDGWSAEEFYPYLDHVLNCFGGDRVMYGSDWPVCLVAGDYAGVKSIVEGYLDLHCPDVKPWVFGRNAQKFYDLKE